MHTSYCEGVSVVINLLTFVMSGRRATVCEIWGWWLVGGFTPEEVRQEVIVSQLN